MKSYILTVKMEEDGDGKNETAVISTSRRVQLSPQFVFRSDAIWDFLDNVGNEKKERRIGF
jgi:hypothetical protein